MRKTKFTFFLILIFLTAALVFIIVGESSKYRPSDQSGLLDTVEIDENSLSQQQLMLNYKRTVENIFYNWQQQILQQSVSRDDAVLQIREQLLSLKSIPRVWQNLHLYLIMALTSDLNGQWQEAKELYQKMQTDFLWLRDELNNLVASGNDIN